MKRNDIKALHEKTIAELNLMLGRLKDEIRQLSLAKTKEKNVHVASSKKKDAARIITVIREKSR